MKNMTSEKEENRKGDKTENLTKSRIRRQRWKKKQKSRKFGTQFQKIKYSVNSQKESRETEGSILSKKYILVLQNWRTGVATVKDTPHTP